MEGVRRGMPYVMSLRIGESKPLKMSRLPPMTELVVMTSVIAVSLTIVDIGPFP